jgi:hypothetical protein
MKAGSIQSPSIQNSNYATCWTAEELRIQFLAEARDSSPQYPAQVCGPPNLLYNRYQRHEADHSPPCGDVKNGGAILPLPPYVFMAWCLIN